MISDRLLEGQLVEAWSPGEVVIVHAADEVGNEALPHVLVHAGEEELQQVGAAWSADTIMQYQRLIIGQYNGHMITLNQSDPGIWVTWSLSANQTPVSRSHDHSQPIKPQYLYLGLMIAWSIRGQQASIQLIWLLSINWRPSILVFKSCDHSQPIRALHYCSIRAVY